MATTSPLTGAPVPEAGDDVEELLEVDDAIYHLEQYVVLRATTTGVRDSLLPAPVRGQVITVGTSAANTQVQVHDGTSWYNVWTAEDWTAYTPTWGSTGTAPTIGNGAITGRYKVVNGVCHFSLKLVVGGTSTVGTGSYTFTLPIASAAAATDTMVHADFFDASAARHYPGNGSVTTGSGSVARTYLEGNVVLGATTPAVPASADQVVISGTYEV